MSDVVSTIDNIISHWNMDESSGTRADSASNGNDLTDNNTVGSGTGADSNTCADFESTNNESLSIADGTQTGLDPGATSDLSGSVWVKPESFPADMCVCGKWGGSGSTNSWLWTIRSGGQFYLMINDGSNTLRVQTSSSHLSAGTWSHIGFSFDQSISTLPSSITLYHNGSSVAQTTQVDQNATGIQDGTAAFRVGELDNGALPYDGLMQHLTLTNDIITSGEFSTLYNSGTPLPYEATASGIFVPKVIMF